MFSMYNPLIIDGTCKTCIRSWMQGIVFKLRAHGLQMYIHNGCRAIDTVQHVSHLCHNTLCVRIEHLSLETAHINNNRQICKNNGESTGHYGFARCILH